MQTEQRATIRQQILRILHECGDYMLPAPRLIEQLQASVAPPPTATEARLEITWLCAHDYIAGVTPELGGPVKWKITDEGRSLL